MTVPALAQQPPTNLDAEETVVGSLLLAGASNAPAWIDKVRETGLQPFHFYRESHGRLYALIVELAEAGSPFDPISVAAALPAGIDVTSDRVHELGALTPAIGLAPHHATLVVDAHRRRQAYTLAQKLERAALAGEIPQEITAELQRLLDEPSARSSDLKPLWLEQALTEEIPEISEYVEGVLEAGVLFDIVGLPYLHKSAAALELAVKVAKGRGLFLGKYPIKAQAKVAYFWADDSRPQELKRIQAYAAANGLAGRDTEVAFYLNPGISLPEDLPAIRRQIREHGYRMLIFDSLYNFADFDFVKDTGAVKHLYTQLKRLCDDVEGLTIGLVDHASKPSDSNRDRDDSISSYGAVWKAAAVRCSIVVTKKGPSLFVSATGNNVKGFPRTPAYFNQERLELALAEEQEADPQRETRIEDLVLDYITRNPGKSTNWIQRSVKGRNADIKAAIVRLEAAEMIEDTYKNTLLNEEESPSQPIGTTPDGLSEGYSESPSQHDGTKKGKTCWIPLNKAKEIRPDGFGTAPDEPRPDHGSFRNESPSQNPSLYVVEGGEGTDPQESPGTQADHHLPPLTDDPPQPDWI